jgi:peroxiredoxin
MVLLIGALVFFSSCHTTKKKSSTFEIDGDLAQAGEGIKVYLDRQLPNDSIEHLDSTTIDKEGKFVFNTEGIYKGFYVVRITKGDFAELILDSNEKVQFTGNAQNLGYTYNVSGSPDSKFFWEYNMKYKTHMMQMDSMEHVFEVIANSMGRDKAKMDSLNNVFEKPFDSLALNYYTWLKKKIRVNIGLFTCLPAIQELSPDSDEAYYYSLDSALTKLYPNSLYVKLFHSRTEAMKRVDIGAMAPDFSIPDTAGKMVTMSSFRGKYLLIDFWASWCEPCKESLPGLVKIYDKYKDKNFTVLGVSLDKRKREWLRAINELKLEWTQVSELKEMKSKVVDTYNFIDLGIPFSVLVSPDGKILAKRLTDSELDDKLHELLDKQDASQSTYTVTVKDTQN